MKNTYSDLKKEVSLLSRVDQRLTLSFGALILSLMIIVLIVSGVYLKGVMDREEQKLSTLFTQVLAASVSRVSFSGRYHAQLLLEDTQKEYSDIRFLLITDLHGRVLASTIKQNNKPVLIGESKKAAEKVLLQNIDSQTQKSTYSGEPILEITLPYHGGYNHKIQGVIQVGLSTLKRQKEIERGIILITLMLALLLVVGIIVVRKISQHFGKPIHYLASDMAATLNAIPDLLFELDMSGRYLKIMANKKELLADTRDRLLGKTVSEVLPKQSALTVMDALKEADELGESHGQQISIPLADGIYWFELSIARKQSVNTNDLSFIVLSRDITARKKAEQELYEYREHLEELVNERTINLKIATDEAERANTAKSEFLSRMSHELRTPMNAILGFAQLLEISADVNDKKQSGNIKEILSAGYHLLGLINEVLDLARIESGKLTILIENISLDEVIAQCISLVKPQMEVQHVTLQDHISGQDFNVKVDSTRLKQVVLNLLSNAVKYNYENGTITLDLRVINDETLRINVTSTGTCLTKTQIGKLFTPFERLEAQNSIEGTGIGLVICKRLIEAMKGTIGVESEEGRGNTFWIEIVISNEKDI